MKLGLGVWAALVLCTGAWGNQYVREVAQPLSLAYVPQGFDTDDGIEIVVAGVLKDSCSRIGRLSSDLDQANKRIIVRLTAYEYSGNCITANFPFYLTIPVGLLQQPGYYNIQDGTSARLLGRLGVQQAPVAGSGVDSAVYAPLTDAIITRRDGRDTLVLKGFVPMDCLTIDTVDLLFQPDVLVALPRMTKIPGQVCKNGNFPFTKAVPIQKALPRGVFLLHARSMGGRSINKIVPGT